ncbi:MAG: DUF3093 family protein [Actinobacteria bacterium]|nr:DUF3093 family protein [Actinomycetota bacterium]
MANPAQTRALYREIVTPKWTSFLPLTLIFPTFWLALAPINAYLGIILGTLITIASALALIYLSPVIEVSKSAIRVGRANLPIQMIGDVISVPSDRTFAERGPNLDARAYVRLQSSRSGLVKIEVLDRLDLTPYWLFSAKKPEKIVEAISEAKKAS